jgi:hypothetical protein
LKNNLLLGSFAVIIFASMVLFSTFSDLSYAAILSKPIWLMQGAFAEYSFEDGVVELFNKTSQLGFDFAVFSIAHFRWDCIGLNESTAELKITLNVTETSRNGKALEENKTTIISTEVFVNIISRAVYLKNGILIGTTHLWLPANPDLGRIVRVWDVPPYEVNLKVANQTSYCLDSPQGRQKMFKVEGSGNTGGTKSLFTILSDYDTGILIDGGLNNEGTMRALNVRDFAYNGRMLFTDTNIDLGPNDFSFDIITIATVLAIPISFSIIFLAVYRQKRKRH